LIVFPNTDIVFNGIVKIIHVKYLSWESFCYVKGTVRRVTCFCNRWLRM